MRILIAMDSFKGSLGSMEAGCAVKEAALKIYPDARVTVRPMADGGEGTTQTLAAGMPSRKVTVTVAGPRMDPVEAEYCILTETNTAVIEMAAASGLTLLPLEKRDPMETTTYGVGQMILDAMEKGCRQFLVGIGGSATNDGGTGMLTALGYRFLDGEGKPVPLCGKGLENLKKIDTEKVCPTLKECTFRIACDVTNPLCGETGCSHVFGPQKGATPEAIEKMDGWLQNYALLAGADKEQPGAGAAGGLGYGFLAFTNATLDSGVQTVLEVTRLEEDIREADLVITGEGRLDGQTVMGKAPIGVAKLAKKYAKPVIAFAGCVTEDATACNEQGIDAYFPILRGVTTLEEALCPENARKNLFSIAYQVFLLDKTLKKI